jgi:leader peptidase (prepilin peptidase)/N-methyltransferase
MLAALGGAASTGGALLALHYLTGRRGIGLGDVKLATAIGAGAGAGVAAVAVAAAFVLGGAYGVWLLATRRAAHGTAVRFGPFLAAGTSLALLFPAGIR